MINYMRTFLLLGIVLLAVAPVNAASNRQTPTSQEVRARMIQLIDSLEKDPFAKDEKAARREVLQWLTAAPDVSVSICTDLLIDLKKLKGDEGGALLTQLPFAEAKFLLEHPEQASDSMAVHRAGVEGVIRTYAIMKAQKPKLRLDPIEKLVQLQTEGKLGEFVKAAVEKCTK